MSKKKKKHVQTEKERLFQEEAARKRAEKAEAKRRNERRNALFLLLIAAILFALSLGFTVWTVVRMHHFETDYVTVKGTITDYRTHHSPSTKHSSWSYTLVITYRVDGQEYTFSDTAGYKAPPTDLIGNATDIYVNPQNPAQAKKVTTAADPALVSAIVFPFCAAFYALGMALVLQERGSSFGKRVLCIWLPVFAWCVASILLFWIGLPNDGFGAVFSRIEGAIGYAVAAGVSLAAVLIDGLVSRRMGRSPRNS